MAHVYAEYPDPRRDEWETKMRPALKKVSLSCLHKATAYPRSNGRCYAVRAIRITKYGLATERASMLKGL